MTTDQQLRESSGTDQQLVSLVRSALVDPNIHTDTRMHICNQIWELLRVHSPAASPAHKPHPAAHPPHYEQLPAVLESVLTDPNVHTDTRIRLDWEIRELLAAQRAEKKAR